MEKLSSKESISKFSTALSQLIVNFCSSKDTGLSAETWAKLTHLYFIKNCNDSSIMAHIKYFPEGTSKSEQQLWYCFLVMKRNPAFFRSLFTWFY